MTPRVLTNAQKTAATERNRDWKSRNPERVAEYNKRTRERYKPKTEEQKEARREWYRLYRARPESKLARAEARWFTRYGITRDDFYALLAAQQGVCAICGGVESQRLHVDHDHTTGAVRGLLCGPCNRGLGSFRDNPRSLQAAVTYLGGTKP